MRSPNASLTPIGSKRLCVSLIGKWQTRAAAESSGATDKSRLRETASCVLYAWKRRPGSLTSQCSSIARRGERHDPDRQIPRWGQCCLYPLFVGKNRESEEISPGIVFDFDKNGHIVGIELLDARAKLPPDLLATVA
jgi:uncharacterized protein YuzE